MQPAPPQGGKPLVTVNIVTRNRAGQLARAIESACAQDYRPIELVVVDNDSSDDTCRVVRSRWPDATLVRLDRNVGCQPGRNVGMRRARGKYIFNLDDDGELAPGALAAIVERFEAEDRLAVVCARTVSPEQDAAAAGRGLRPRYAANFRGGASAVRAAAIEQVGPFPEYPRGGAEYHLSLRLLDAGWRILHLPQAVMVHPEQRSGAVEREHCFYAAWHSLRTAFELQPWPECLVKGLWKLGRECARSLAAGCLGASLCGVCRFLADLPTVLAHRRPVSRRSLRQAAFLTFHFVTDASAADAAQGGSAWRTLGRRLRRMFCRGAAKPRGVPGAGHASNRRTPA